MWFHVHKTKMMCGTRLFAGREVVGVQAAAAAVFALRAVLALAAAAAAWSSLVV